MVALFKRELELCKVTPEETLAVLTQGEGYADYAQGFLAAAQLIGATAYQVNVPAPIAHGGYAANIGKTPIAGNRPVIDALKAADIVIDLMFLLFSDEQNEVTASGTRMLLVIEPLEVLMRMFPMKIYAGASRSVNIYSATPRRCTSPRHLEPMCVTASPLFR